MFWVLYTSVAADEEDSRDLRGRRIDKRNERKRRQEGEKGKKDAEGDLMTVREREMKRIGATTVEGG